MSDIIEFQNRPARDMSVPADVAFDALEGAIRDVWAAGEIAFTLVTQAEDHTKEGGRDEGDYVLALFAVKQCAQQARKLRDRYQELCRKVI